MSIQKLGISLATAVKTMSAAAKPVSMAASSGAGKLAALQKGLQRFSVSDKEFSLLSSEGDVLSSLFFMREKDCVSILDMESNVMGQGYGTKLLQKFIDTFKDIKIKVCAAWERGVHPMPPHKFYMRNGFVPTSNDAQAALSGWITRGANPKDFPLRYELCEMQRLPQ